MMDSQQSGSFPQQFRQKRVLFVTSVNLAGTAGSSVATLSLIKAMIELPNTEVALLAPRPSDPGAIPIEVFEKIMGKFGSRKKSSGIWHLRFALYVRKVIKDAVACNRYDVVVVRAGPFFSLAASCMKDSDMELVALVRGSAYAGTNGIIRKLFAGVVSYFRFRMLRDADRVLIAFQKAISEKEHRVLAGKVSVLANAADLKVMTALDKSIARESLESRMEVTFSEHIVAFVGSIRERHRLPDLLAGIATLRLEGKIVDLLLVGEGPLWPTIKLLSHDFGIANQVKMVGAIPHQDVFLYLSAADVVYGPVDPMNPSNPIKVYEGLAVGRPVITSLTPELKFIGDRQFGIYVGDSIEPTEMASAIRMALALPWSQDNEIATREYIARYHTWQALALQAINGVQ